MGNQTDSGLTQSAPAEAVASQPVPGAGTVENPETNLATATTRGFAWTALSRLIIQVIQFGSTVVLARLLTPDDYGLVGIVAVFTGFAWLFSDLGLGAAVIHREQLTDRLLSTAFWLNALTGVGLTALLCALAVPIADAYHRPALTWIVVLLSLSFTFSLSTVHLAILERRMQFRMVARNEIGAVALGTVVTLACAASGLGPYSLVIGSLTQTISTSALMWQTTGWRPSSFIDRGECRAIWNYSSHLFGFNVVNYWSRNGDNFAVGAAYGARELGFYSRAYNLMMLPIGQVTSALGRVLFPAFSRLRESTDRLSAAYLRTTTTMLAVAMPLAMILSAAALPFVEVVYGSRWKGSAAILAILSLSAAPQIVAGTLGSLYQAVGETKRLFRRGLITSTMTIAAIVIGLPWGVKGIATTLTVKFFLAVPVVAGGVWPRLGLTWSKVLRASAPIIIASALMWGVTRALVHLLDDKPFWLQLISSVVAGLGAYILVLAGVGGSILEEVLLATRLRRPAKSRRPRPTPRHRARS